MLVKPLVRLWFIIHDSSQYSIPVISGRVVAGAVSEKYLKQVFGVDIVASVRGISIPSTQPAKTRAGGLEIGASAAGERSRSWRSIGTKDSKSLRICISVLLNFLEKHGFPLRSTADNFSFYTIYPSFIRQILSVRYLR